MDHLNLELVLKCSGWMKPFCFKLPSHSVQSYKTLLYIKTNSASKQLEQCSTYNDRPEGYKENAYTWYFFHWHVQMDPRQERRLWHGLRICIAHVVRLAEPPYLYLEKNPVLQYTRCRGLKKSWFFFFKEKPKKVKYHLQIVKTGFYLFIIQHCRQTNTHSVASS